MSVSRALRDDTGVSDARRRHIREIAEKLGYLAHSPAANLRLRRTGFVAITIPSINNANCADTVRGLSDWLAEEGRHVQLGYTDYDLRREEKLVHALLQRRPDGLVVTGGRHTEPARRLMRSAGIPVIET